MMDPMTFAAGNRTSVLARAPIAAAALVLFMSAGDVARAEQPDSGFQLAAAVGINVCLADGVDDCKDIDPSVALHLSGGYRIIPNLSVALDFGYGWLSAPAPPGVDLSCNTTYVMPVIRGHVYAGRVDLFAGAGVGWAWFSAGGSGPGGTSSASWSGMGVKLGGGVAIPVTDALSILIQLDGVLNLTSGEMCIEQNGDTACGDVPDSADIADMLQILAGVRFLL